MPLRISRRSTSGGSCAARTAQLQSLAEAPQLGARVYQSLLSGIISGTIEPGASLRPDAIAEQLNVSTTPVREALVILESDRLAINRPYQGWFVRDFSEPEVRGMYALRASLECLAVRLACQRITKEELRNLRSLQARGVAALASGDMDAYRIYNRDLHASIVGSARNSYLCTAMQQLSLQSQMLAARTIRVAGRPSRAISEHERLIECIARGDSNRAEQIMERHILGALKDVLKHGKRSDTAPESDT